MTRFRSWKTAARLHTLPAAVVPVLVGGGLAYGDEVFRWDAFSWALIGALSIQIAANFANDASDAHRGADTAERLGP
ncbi:MAG TPA: 1,4-dihydroxy-2-naphthoate polyprenyltransferase, partial [Acidimicrobiia bacterium]